jgi:hypothetical protein
MHLKSMTWIYFLHCKTNTKWTASSKVKDNASLFCNMKRLCAKQNWIFGEALQLTKGSNEKAPHRALQIIDPG